MSLSQFLFGRPLATNEEGEQRVGPVSGIPMLGLDALSSAAYGPEAAMTLLIPLGAAGVCSGVGALVSAAPSLQPHTLPVCLAILAFAFREPSVANARRTLTAIIAILIVLLAGIAYLVGAYRIAAATPGEAGYQSVLSLLVAAVVGRGVFSYVSIAAILAVLALSANTGFADFPRLCRMISCRRPSSSAWCSSACNRFRGGFRGRRSSAACRAARRARPRNRSPAR